MVVVNDVTVAIDDVTTTSIVTRFQSSTSAKDFVSTLAEMERAMLPRPFSVYVKRFMFMYRTEISKVPHTDDTLYSFYLAQRWCDVLLAFDGASQQVSHIISDIVMNVKSKLQDLADSAVADHASDLEQAVNARLATDVAFVKLYHHYVAML